jgi:hypothetical protein
MLLIRETANQGFLRHHLAQGLCIFFVIALRFLMGLQNTQVSETKEFRNPYFRKSNSKNDLKGACIYMWCYRGAVVTPKWKDVDTRKP